MAAFTSCAWTLHGRIGWPENGPFDGITGQMSFNPEGDHDPVKCAVVVKIDDAGKFGFYKSVCPN